jgi:hypothetical protein
MVKTKTYYNQISIEDYEKFSINSKGVLRIQKSKKNILEIERKEEKEEIKKEIKKEKLQEKEIPYVISEKKDRIQLDHSNLDRPKQKNKKKPTKEKLVFEDKVTTIENANIEEKIDTTTNEKEKIERKIENNSSLIGQSRRVTIVQRNSLGNIQNNTNNNSTKIIKKVVVQKKN